MKESQTYQLIENYLLDNCSDLEKSQVDTLLATDQDFRETFEQQKEIHEMVIDHRILTIKEQINADLKENRINKQKTKQQIRIGGTATFVLILMGLGTWFIQPKSTITQIKKVVSNKNETILIKTTKTEQQVDTIEKNTKEVVATINKTTRPVEKTNLDSILLPDIQKHLEQKKIENELPISILESSSPSQILTNENTQIQDKNSICETIQYTTTPSFTEKCRKGDGRYLKIELSNLENCKKTEIELNLNGKESKSMEFKNFQAGENILVSTVKNCQKESRFYIDEIECDMSFFADNEETIILMPLINGELTIMNQNTGESVYNKILSTDTEFEWNGTDLNGNKLPKGLYIYQLKSQTSTEQIIRSITIL